jgi:hypothetical protein
LGDLIEPLETFQKLYNEEVNGKLRISDRTWQLFNDTQNKAEGARELYFNKKWDVEKSEI